MTHDLEFDPYSILTSVMKICIYDTLWDIIERIFVVIASMGNYKH